MKCVIDTNVFISGIFWSGSPHTIIKAWKTKKIDVAITFEILNEYKRVADTLSGKYPRNNFLINDLELFIDLLSLQAEICIPAQLPAQISRDPDDDKFLACAQSAHASYIISGDNDLLDISGYFDIQIITPRTFADSFLKD